MTCTLMFLGERVTLPGVFHMCLWFIGLFFPVGLGCPKSFVSHSLSSVFQFLVTTPLVLVCCVATVLPDLSPVGVKCLDNICVVVKELVVEVPRVGHVPKPMSR